MFIQFENTPNPEVLKFLPGQPVWQGAPLEFEAAEPAQNSPLAQRIFASAPVQSVFLGADFLSVTKSPDQDWVQVKPLILNAIMEHFQSGDAVVLDDQERHLSAVDETDDPVIAQIRELLDTRVRPAVAQDGGDIVFHGFDKGIVYLYMKGACAGCPSATMTLKMGIENLLRHYIPDVIEVRPVA